MTDCDIRKDIKDFKDKVIEHSIENRYSENEAENYYISLNILLKTKYKKMCNLELEEVAYIMKIERDEVIKIENLVLKKFKDPTIAVKLMNFTTD